MTDFWKWRLVKATESITTSEYQEVHQWADFCSISLQDKPTTIAYNQYGRVIDVAEDGVVVVFPGMGIIGQKHYAIKTNSVVPVYEKYERPLYRYADRKTQVSFKTLKIRRGWESIEDVYNAIRPFKAFIAGGYAAWMVAPDQYTLSNRTVSNEWPVRKDADIFIADDSTQNTGHLGAAIKGLGFTQVSVSPIVATFKPPPHLEKKGCPVLQIVTPRELKNGRTSGTHEQVIDSFDFTVARAALLDKNCVVADVDLEKDMASKQLRIKNMHCPIGQTIRLEKYVRKGFTSSHFQKYLVMEYARRQKEDLSELAASLETMQEFGDQQYWLADQLPQINETLIDAVDPSVVNDVYFGLYLD